MPTPALSVRSSLADITSAYDRMEASIELEYAKLIQETKGEKAELEEKIRNLEKQIAALKDLARKLELIARKIDALLPKILAEAGGDAGPARGRTPTSKSGDLASHVREAFAREGLTLSPDEVRRIVDALAKGGSGAMALAISITMAIVEARGQGIGDSIVQTRKAIEEQRKAIKALDDEVLDLQKKRDAEIAAVRKQKAKALQEAIRLAPTATPTPAKR